MSAPSWRRRREAYLRDRGRWADLIREGYIQHRFVIVEGAGKRTRGESSTLVIVADGGGRRQAENEEWGKLVASTPVAETGVTSPVYPLPTNTHEEERKHVATTTKD
jgi:hypothetical protein